MHMGKWIKKETWVQEQMKVKDELLLTGLIVESIAPY